MHTKTTTAPINYYYDYDNYDDYEYCYDDHEDAEQVSRAAY